MLPANPLLNATAPAGPHLPTATLRQYAAGTLAPAARHRVEAHTLACPRCADILAGLLQTPATTTDQALAQLQQRLRLRVQQAESARPVAGRVRVGHRWVVPQLAAAATLLFGLVAGGWWTWQQRHPTPTATVATATSSLPPAAAKTSVSTDTGIPTGATETPSSNPGSTAATGPTQPAAPTRHATLATRYGRPTHHAHQPSAATYADTAATSASSLAGGLAAPADLAAAPTAAAPSPAASLSAASAVPGSDSTGLALRERAPGANQRRMAVAAAPAMVRADAMPAARALPPAPVGGYSAWREQLRREATEFKPDEGGSLSGSVQLRLTIGPDGKIQQIKVLHGLRADYDEEAQRLVCDGPGWVPGIGGGKRAAQSIDVAVPFQ